MQLVIAEKPSVARDLARVLGLKASGRNSLEGDGRVITWCIGHLVELEEPAAYDPRWKAWRMDTLPMIPPVFKLRPVAGTRDQFRVVCDLLRERRFTEVVNGCDAGREGELIFRYVYELAGSRLPVRRLWISSLTDEAIRRGFAGLRPGAAYDPLADAARSRSEADWLVGMNATRAVTMQFRATGAGGGTTQGKSGMPPVYSIGRVQTPTLAILVRREQAIRAFKPRDYWEVRGTFTGDANTFTALWTTRGESGKGAITRLAVRAHADQVVVRCADSAAAAEQQGGGGPVVESLTQKQTREPPPQLFDLTSLQRTANRRYGFSATRTLEAAQALYERHKVLTYPRTDSRYLPQDLVGELPRLFAGLAKLPAYEEFAKPLLAGDAGALGRSRRIFDAAKVHDHHAIIPTGKVPAGGALGPDEQRLYDLVVRRFLGAFHPDAEFALTEAVIRVGLAAPDPLQADTTSGARAAPDHRGGNPAEAPAGVRARGAGEFGDEPMLGSLPLPPDRFIARGRVRLVAGWQAVAGFDERPGAGAGAGTIDQRDRRGGGGVGGGGRKEGSAATEPIEPLLPPLTKGQRLGGRFEALPHQTRPPPRHTEATLLGAMESAGREMEDEELRAAMKDTGLGTPATRAATIETLVKRSFIAREGKQVVPTAVGIDLIERLPVATLASPELTGAWEARLVRIARGDETRAAFMTDIAAYVSEVTAAVRAGMRARRAGTGEIARTAAPARVADRGDAATAVTPTKPSEKAAGKRAGKRVASAPGSGASARAPAMREKRAGGGAVALTCPRCRQGTLMAGNRGWGCSRWREGCPFVIWFEAAGKRITAGQLRDLVEKGRTRRFGQIGQIGQIGGAERMTKAPQGRLVLDLTASRESGGARFSPD